MEADLQHYYRLDLRDLWRGRLTVRRLKVLLESLPADSLWATALRQRPDIAPVTGPDGVDGMRWGSIHDLLASLIDATTDVAWTVAQVNARKRLPAPARVPRPSPGGARRIKRGISARNLERLQAWRSANRTRR